MGNIYREDIVDIELNSGTLHRSFINMAIGEGDANGNRYGFRLMKGGVPVSLAGGACVGYLIRADNITLVINGTAESWKAYVELPAAAYAAEGNFTLAIKISGTGYSGTMRIIDGTVVNTTSGTINDPSSQVPSLQQLTAIIAAAEAAAEEIGKISTYAEQIEGTRYKIGVAIEEEE